MQSLIGCLLIVLMALIRLLAFVTGNLLKLKEVKAFLGEETNPKFVLVNQELDRAFNNSS